MFRKIVKKNIIFPAIEHFFGVHFILGSNQIKKESEPALILLLTLKTYRKEHRYEAMNTAVPVGTH